MARDLAVFPQMGTFPSSLPRSGSLDDEDAELGDADEEAVPQVPLVIPPAVQQQPRSQVLEDDIVDD